MCDLFYFYILWCFDLGQEVYFCAKGHFLGPCKVMSQHLSKGYVQTLASHSYTFIFFFFELIRGGLAGTCVDKPKCVES